MVIKKSMKLWKRICTLAVCFVAPLVSWANFAMINPVTGETENYTWKFVGTDTWNGTGYWQDSNGGNPSGVPAKSGGNTWDPILFDGNTININASMSVEGWNLRMGLYNGANVTMNTFVKYQGDTTMWMTVDETSQLTIGGFNGGNMTGGQKVKLSVAKKNGIIWNTEFKSSNANNTYEYYLKGEGSVSYEKVSAASHKIKQADVTLSGGDKEVKSKTLVTLGDTSTVTFTADATIKRLNSSGTDLDDDAHIATVNTTGTTTLTTDDAVGTCELVQTSTGIVLYWVDGDPAEMVEKTYKPSISINFTSGTDLSTAADVGVGDYSIPGTSWNNLIGNNGSLTTVTGVDSTGAASTITGAKVTISGTRGYWTKGSLDAASDLRQGYIDDADGNATPTVVVEGIPYYSYKLVVYFSNDTDGRQFGHLTINGTNYNWDSLNSEIVTCEGTSSDVWGSSSSTAYTEGGNYLVFPTILNADGTLTIVGHRWSGSLRAGVAAIQIVEVDADSKVIENGGVLQLDSPQTKALRVTCEGSFAITGTDAYTVTANDLMLLDLSDVTGTVTLGTNTCCALGSDRALPEGFLFGEGSAVEIAETRAEYGRGEFWVSGLTGVSFVRLTRFGGEGVETLNVNADGEASFESPVHVSGLATKYDYEFDGDLTSVGSDTSAMNYDTGMNSGNSFFNSTMLYTYTHPYSWMQYPSEWTAMVRCTTPKVPYGVVVMFGTWFNGAIGLIAGEDPETKMYLVSTPGYNDIETKTEGCMQYIVLKEMDVADATTAHHTYVFKMNDGIVDVYCDGRKVLANYDTEITALGEGLQIGSLHGGIAREANYPTGLVRVWKGDSYAGLTNADLEHARIDSMRIYDYSISDAQVEALSVEFPSVTIYRATAVAETDGDWESLEWSPSWDGGNSESTVVLTTEGDATISLPESIAADELQFILAADSTLTLSGDSTLDIAEPVYVSGGTVKLTGTLTLDSDLTLMGKLIFADSFETAGVGTLKIAAGATVATEKVIVMTVLGEYTCADGTVVDSAYSEEGKVKFIPEGSAVASLTTGGATSYYTDISDGFSAFGSAAATDVTATLNILDGTDLSEYVALFVAAGYKYDKPAGTLTVALAKTGSDVYDSLAEAVAAVADDGTVWLQRTSSEEITLNKAITLNGVDNYSGTLSGDGTLELTIVPSAAMTFGEWSGKVVLPTITSCNPTSGLNLNDYGKNGSTVVLTGISSGVWLSNAAIAPNIELAGDVTLSAFSSSFPNTFKVLTGTGSLSLTSEAKNGYFLLQNVEGFTGSLSTTGPGIAIGASKPSRNTYAEIYITTQATVGEEATWTAENGIVLADANATLTVKDGGLAPEPTTTVADSHVKTTAGEGETVYSVEADAPAVVPIDPSQGGSATYDDADAATSAAEAINADKDNLITLPTALTTEQKETYLSYVEAKATGNKVDIVFSTAGEVALQTAVDAETEDLAAAIATVAATADDGSVTIAATPGFYYVVEAGTEPGVTPAASCTLATGSSLELTIPNKGEKGFYRLRVSVTPVEVPSAD